MLNDPEVPFFRKEPSIIKPYDYALKMLGTTVSLEPHMSGEERNKIAVAYLKVMTPWLGNGTDDKRINL